MKRTSVASDRGTLFVIPLTLHSIVFVVIFV